MAKARKKPKKKARKVKARRKPTPRKTRSGPDPAKPPHN
jgi:hypothetical protein